MMIALADPRLPILIDTLKKDEGDGLFYYGTINAPVEFITFDELQFATAEMILRNGGSFAASQAFLNQAIQQNMVKLGVKDADIATYLAAHGQMPTSSVDAAIGFIASQAYLGLYLNPEAWATWRRTNSPALTPVTGTSVPRRLLYPQTEYSYNKDHVPASVTVFAPKVFWDN
jgi:Starch-binding associating with outer membrane